MKRLVFHLLVAQILLSGIVHLNAQGFSKQFYDEFYTVCSIDTFPNGEILIGSANGLARLNSNGNLVSCLKGQNYTEICASKIHPNGNIAWMAQENIGGDLQVIFGVMNQNGVMLWTKSILITGESSYGYPGSILFSQNGNITFSFSLYSALCIINATSTGTINFKNLYSDTNIFGKCPGFTSRFNGNGDIVTTAKSLSDICIVTVSSVNGSVISSYKLNDDVNFGYYHPIDFQILSDDSYIVVGYRDPFPFAARINASGQAMWAKIYADAPFDNGMEGFFYSVNLLSNGNYLLSGYSSISPKHFEINPNSGEIVKVVLPSMENQYYYLTLGVKSLVIGNWMISAFDNPFGVVVEKSNLNETTFCTDSIISSGFETMDFNWGTTTSNTLNTLALPAATNDPYSFSPITISELSLCSRFLSDNSNESKEENLQIFPNPTEGEFSVRFNSENQRISRITVYDLFGKVVYNLPCSSTNVMVNLSWLEGGLYIVDTEDQLGNKYIRHIIKQ